MTDWMAQKFLSDLFTISYCVSTSSHYRYRCHWERNQILSVCVGPNNWSVWVQSFSQLCSPPFSAQFLVISSAFFFLLRCLCFVWQTQTIALFIYAPCHIALQRHRFLGSFCCCICAGIDQEGSDCKCDCDAVKVDRKSFVLVFSSVCVHLLWLVCQLYSGNLTALHRKTGKKKCLLMCSVIVTYLILKTTVNCKFKTDIC